jgi:predicted enzyme related to lactoylglutathione lyase
LKRYGILASLLLVLISSCATTGINLPAVTETPNGQFQPGKIIWRDLITDTPAESRRFYEELFGWTFQSVGNVLGLGNDDTYTLIRHNGQLIGGMVDANQFDREVEISQWVVVMSVEDVDAAAEVFRAGNGSVLTPPTNMSDRGRLAVVADPQGALLALLQTTDGDPVDRQPDYGDFLWDELWTTDPEAASSFYRQVASYDDARSPVQGDPESSYRVLESDGQPRIGMMAHPFDTARPVWVSYIRVEDPAAITARVIALGGEIFVDAQSRSIGGEAALIAGPSGAGIALQTWPLEATQERAQ